MMSSDVYVYQQNMQQTDKDELFVCPYDPVHRITAKRFVRHILKCQKNHPKSNKKICPFNARHIIPKPELQMHISMCPDKRLLEHEINCERIAFRNSELRGDTSVPSFSTMEDLDFGSHEDWDEEINQGMQVVHNVETRREEIHQHMQATRRMNDREPTGERRSLQDRPAFGIGRGKNLLRTNDNEQKRPAVIPTSGIQLAANFSRKPLTQSRLENGLGRGRRHFTGPNLVPQRRDHVIVNREMDAEIGKNIKATTQLKSSNESSEASSSENGSVCDPTQALRKEKKRLLKLLKQISQLETQFASGSQLNADETIKMNRKPLVETRLFEIDLELGED
uniref:Uncharacterized protein LOC100176891 n=1 Tax=Phallusia mammillata TaxID=59560 RepID=A0A6F9DHA8_9ASCI|nr:uncharacterized protein LOC100176891 [Phallusia mammillata]